MPALLPFPIPSSPSPSASSAPQQQQHHASPYAISYPRLLPSFSLSLLPDDYFASAKEEGEERKIASSCPSSLLVTRKRKRMWKKITLTFSFENPFFPSLPFISRFSRTSSVYWVSSIHFLRLSHYPTSFHQDHFSNWWIREKRIISQEQEQALTFAHNLRQSPLVGWIWAKLIFDSFPESGMKKSEFEQKNTNPLLDINLQKHLVPFNQL